MHFITPMRLKKRMLYFSTLTQASLLSASARDNFVEAVYEIHLRVEDSCSTSPGELLWEPGSSSIFFSTRCFGAGADVPVHLVVWIRALSG